MTPRTARDYKELLRTGRWFNALSDELQDLLLSHASIRVLRSGQRLFSRGDPPCGLYCALDGAIQITGTSESGKATLLIVVEPPSWFGEIAVFDGLPRTHDATANEDGKVLHIPQTALDSILTTQPKYWRELGLLVASKLRLAFHAMEDMAVAPLAVRLARRLLLMTQGYGELKGLRRRVVEVKQEQLAMMLSASRQTINQLLKELETKGIIKLTYGEIDIVDQKGLLSIAQMDDST